MASLYRKWRPQNFEGIVGQEHIKKTLVNALRSRHAAHAYLFTGPRGTGKTTTARLIAKTLNCEKVDFKNKDGKVYEPCNDCPSCLEITSGQSLDVMEIDAASNRGIEEIRDLREKVKFTPIKSNFKIFIIDEVHMLTREAFNALLKTLEEPPSYAVFILATTEAHKVLPTIVSRCQRYDFRRGQIGELKEKIKQVSKDEKFKISDGAIDLIARLSDGSFRDALSLLDQISSVYGVKEKISEEEVKKVLGLSGTELMERFFETLLRGDIEGVVRIFDQIVDEGGDIGYFASRLLEINRRLMLIRGGVGKEVAAPEWTDEEYDNWEAIAEKYRMNELLFLLNSLAAVLPDVKKSPIAQLPMEVLAIDWMQTFDRTKPEKEITVSYTESVKYDEPAKMQDLVKVESGTVNTNVDSVTQAEPTVAGALSDEKEIWQKMLEMIDPINHPLCMLLKEARLIAFDREKVQVGVRFRFHSERIHDVKNRQAIETTLSQLSGRSLRLECIIDDKLPKPQLVAEQELLNTAVEVFGME